MQILNRLSRFQRVTVLATCVVGALVAFVVLRSSNTMSDEEFREQCRSLREQESWTKLAATATDWSEATEMPDEALLFLADAEIHSGNSDRAIECLLSVPSKSSRCYPAMITACNLQFGEVNKPLDGVETLKKMIKRNPSSISSRQRLIFFYAVSLQREKMLEAIFDAVQAKAEPPDAYGYLMLADSLSFSNGFTKNSEWLKSDPESELFQVARTIQLLNILTSSDSPQNEQALTRCQETFDTLLRRYPENRALLEHAIAEAADEFDLPKVEQLIAQAPSPSTSVILRWQGWLSFQKDQFSESVELLQRSIAVYPLDWQAWNELAKAKRRLGDLDEASKAAQIAIAGKEIRKTVLQLEDVSAIAPATLEEMASYFASCGMEQLAVAILSRLRAGQTPN